MVNMLRAPGIWLILAALLIFAVKANAASCPLPNEVGIWEGDGSSAVGELTRLEISHSCNAKGLENWRVRALAKCSPRACTWGYAPAQRDAGQLVAVFNTFLAERWVRMRIDGSQLRAEMLIAPRDRTRRPRRYSRHLKRVE